MHYTNLVIEYCKIIVDLHITLDKNINTQTYNNYKHIIIDYVYKILLLIHEL